MLEIDKLSDQSRWRQLDPMRKLALYGLFLLLAMCTSPRWQAALLVIIAAHTCWLLRIGPRRYLTWMLLPLGFLLTSVITMTLSVSASPASLLYSVPVGDYWFGVDRIGIATANHTFWRSLAALAATLWFVLNTPFPQLVQVLRRCRVPTVLVELILLTWRFVFIFLDEAAAIYRAQSLRFGYLTLRSSYRSLAMLVGMLFTRVMVRYQQTTTALEVKLYRGDFPL